MHLRLISTLVPPPNVIHSEVPDISPLTKPPSEANHRKEPSPQKNPVISLPFSSQTLLSLQIQRCGCLFSLKIDYLLIFCLLLLGTPGMAHVTKISQTRTTDTTGQKSPVQTIEQKFTHI